MHATFRPLRLAAAVLVLVSAPALASSATAQGRSAEDTRTIESYRLTMPMLRKALPALYAPGGESCKENPPRDPFSLSLAEIRRKLETCPPLATSLRDAGVEVRQAALIFAAILDVSRAVALRGGKATELSPGVVRDNALLLEQYDSEIRKLTPIRGQS